MEAIEEGSVVECVCQRGPGVISFLSEMGWRACRLEEFKAQFQRNRMLKCIGEYLGVVAEYF
jgi:hypothetical protein